MRPDSNIGQCSLNPRLGAVGIILWNKYAELGPRWVAIAKLFPGRSKNSVRNRFLHLQRQRNRADPKRSEGEQPKPEEDPFRLMDATHPDQFIWEASSLDE
jgi:hypothetical protein